MTAPDEIPNGLWGTLGTIAYRLGALGLAFALVGLGGWRILGMQEKLNAHLISDGQRLTEAVVAVKEFMARQTATQEKIIELQGDTNEGLERLSRCVGDLSDQITETNNRRDGA